MFIDTTAAATVHPTSTHRRPYRGVPHIFGVAPRALTPPYKTNARHKLAER